MRGIILTLTAFVVMTGVAIADPTLCFVEDDLYVANGYKSYVVQALGTNINVLGDFTITGSRAAGEDVYQVWADASTPSEWLGDGSATGAAQDSYVMVGSLRVPDLAGGSGGGNPPATAETISGGGASGIGTLNNYLAGPPEKADGYLRLAGVDYTPDTAEVIDLFHLVLPDGAYATVNAKLMTADYDGEYYTVTGEYDLSIQVNCLLDGDVNKDGQVTLGDATILGGNYLGAGGWAQGDMTGDGQITLGDATVLGGNYGTQADWYGTAYGAGCGGGEAAGGIIPEPGTIIMLVLGGLCLAGYRLRK